MKSTSKEKIFLLIITMISVTPLLSSDIYLPSFPSIASDFHIMPIAVQLTLSAYLLTLGILQIPWGVLSDVFGRRKLLLTALALYSIGSVICLFSHSLPMLIGGRIIQAVGACAGLVLGRAIINDVYDVTAASKILAIIYSFVALSPAMAPITGGYLAHLFGWRSVFLLLSVYGAVSFVLFFMYVPETKTSRLSMRERVKPLFSDFTVMVKDKLFMGYSLSILFAYGAYFAYISQSPFLFSALGVKTESQGYLYVPVALSYICFVLWGRRLITKMSPASLVSRGTAIYFIGGLSMFFLALTGFKNLTAIVGPMTLLTCGNGFVLPFAMAGAIGLYRKSAGTASGLVGTIQLAGASMSACLVGGISAGKNALPLSSLIVVLTGLGCLGFFYLSRRKRLFISENLNKSFEIPVLVNENADTIPR